MGFSGRFTDRLRFPILLAVVALLLLPLPASAQITVLPTQGKSLGSASAPEPGKWIVFAAGFLPVQPVLLDGGKTILWEGDAGDYAVIYLPPGDAQPVVQRVTLGGTVTPPIPPDPPPVNAKWQVLFFVESADLDSLTLPQLEMVSGLLFRQELNKAGHKFLGTFDKDRSSGQTVVSQDGTCLTVQRESKYDVWWKAITGKAVPLVAIAPIAGGDIQTFPLPANAAALDRLLSEAKP